MTGETKVTTNKEIIDGITQEWRRYADTKNVAEKRRSRLNYLIKLQVTLFRCDLKLFRDIIIALCRQCHGGNYEYPFKLNRPIQLNEQIVVQCKTHGKMNIRLLDHLLPPEGTSYPIGCMLCLHDAKHSSGGRKLTTAEFISKSEIKHGSTYCYEESVFKSVMDEIDIMCPECEKLGFDRVFHQPARNHLIGNHCYACSRRSVGKQHTLTIDDFNEMKSKDPENKNIYVEMIHPDSEHNYSRIRYFCGVCGEERTPKASAHKAGKGCWKCGRKSSGKKRSMTLERWFEGIPSERKNGNTFKEMFPDEKSGKSRVRYTCGVCGTENTPLAASYKFGFGCKTCSDKKVTEGNSISFEEARTICSKVHDGKGNEYIKMLPTDGIRAGQRIVFRCGSCKQIRIMHYGSHRDGHGCKYCEMHGTNMSHAEYPIRFYLLKIDLLSDTGEVAESAYKIGCSKNGIHRRMRGNLQGDTSYEVVYQKVFTPGKLAFELEQAIKTKMSELRYSGKIIISNGGNNELFTEEAIPHILKYIEAYVGRHTSLGLR